jgi:hypothetical protein
MKSIVAAALIASLAGPTLAQGYAIASDHVVNIWGLRGLAACQAASLESTDRWVFPGANGDLSEQIFYPADDLPNHMCISPTSFYRTGFIWYFYTCEGDICTNDREENGMLGDALPELIDGFQRTEFIYINPEGIEIRRGEIRRVAKP